MKVKYERKKFQYQNLAEEVIRHFGAWMILHHLPFYLQTVGDFVRAIQRAHAVDDMAGPVPLSMRVPGPVEPGTPWYEYEQRRTAAAKQYDAERKKYNNR